MDFVFAYEWLGSDRVSEFVGFLVMVSAGIIVLQRSQRMKTAFHARCGVYLTIGKSHSSYSVQHINFFSCSFCAGSKNWEFLFETYTEHISLRFFLQLSFVKAARTDQLGISI